MDEFLIGEMDVVYQANDDEFSYLKAQVKENKAKTQGGLFSNIYRTVMDTCRETCRKKITGVPDTPVTENNSSNTLDNLGGSYLGNVLVWQTQKTDNIAEQALTEQLNGLVITTFCNLLQHINTDSLSEVSPKAKQYNETISSFIADTSNRYGLTLSYTSLFVEDVSLWAQTFNITTKNAIEMQIVNTVLASVLQ